MKSPDKPRPLHAFLALLLAFVVYAPSMTNDFAMDDEPLAKSVTVKHGVPDPMIAGPDWAWPQTCFQKYYWWPERGNDELYRPVTVYSYALTYNLVSKPFLSPEREAVPHHVINVLLHVWATWLVLQLVVWLGAGGLAALLTALLFGLHAIHSEVVASIIGRAELFSFCFGAQALLWLARGRWWRYLLAAFFFFLAYCSKESSIVWIPFVPCYLLAQGWLQDRDRRILEIWQPHVVPSLLVTLVPLLVCLILRYDTIYREYGDEVVGAAYSSNPLFITGFLTRIFTATTVWGYALGLCFAPFSLCCLYSQNVFELVHSPLDVGFCAALSALLAFLVLGLVYARRSPLLFLGMATFLGFSFVTSNVPIRVGTILGERLYYTPSLGICLLPAAALPWLLKRPRLFVVAMAALSIWMTAAAAMILHRNGVWKNNDALFLNDATVHPECADLQLKAATMYGSGGRKDPEKAEEHLHLALDLQKDFPLAWVSLATHHLDLKQWQQAVAACQQALACDEKILNVSGVITHAHSKMGIAYLEQGREADSIKALVRAFEAPEGTRNHDVYAFLAPMAAGKLPEAQLRKMFAQGREHFPYDADLALVLGGMLYKVAASDGTPNARRDYETVVRTLSFAIRNLKPEKQQEENTYKGYVLLADSLIRCGQRQQGIALYQNVLRDPAAPRDLKQMVGVELRRLLGR
ncbi:MAG: tetratricopeptide repeat protein [Planctomycetota bacterium]|jgi:tetratricopeptide (TPR) repeat protein